MTHAHRLEALSVDTLCIQTMRTLAIDAVQKANSGHPGAPMGMSPMAYVLWTRHMRHNPQDPQWPDRDRFVLSAGHASMLLYGLLHLTGYDVSLDDIKNFRQWGSVTPGHPENHLTSGVETTTGPLGQGFANGVGFALAEAALAATYNTDEHNVVDHHTYVIAGDGCLMEGVSSEAASLAGHLGLGKLIVLYDDNKITIDGGTEIAFTEDVARRFEAFGWHTARVEDGNDLDAIDAAIAQAKAADDKPSLILVRTHIGFGSPNKQDRSSAHGSPLGDSEIALTKAAYGWPTDARFLVPDRALVHMRQCVGRGEADQASWRARFAGYAQAHPERAAELARRHAGELPQGWDELAAFEPSAKGMATRASSGKVIEALFEKLPELFGGSADLAGSNKTYVKKYAAITAASKAGRNINFGVREHAMGSICNGIALHGGFIPYGATFLVFSDYMRPAVRLGALEQAKAIWVWTHDSIGLGEDGPTHQPIEHLAALRAIPKFVVLRPADANETLEAWKVAIAEKRPCGMALTRQDVPTLDRTLMGAASGVARGGYVLSDDDGAELILLGTGSELHIALEAAQRLRAQGVRVRVVSMPSLDLFEEQDAAYKESVLPRAVRARVSIEAGATAGWHRYVGWDGVAMGIDRFGASAPDDVLYEKLGLTVDKMVEAGRASLAACQR